MLVTGSRFFAVVAALVAVACSAADGGGTVDMALHSAADGCVAGPIRYAAGEVIADGCNTCTCLASGLLSCTRRTCVELETGRVLGGEGSAGQPTAGGGGDAGASLTTPTPGDGGEVDAASVGSSPSDCVRDGRHYPMGSSFVTADGCNTCLCGWGGALACTKQTCPVDGG